MITTPSVIMSRSGRRVLALVVWHVVFAAGFVAALSVYAAGAEWSGFERAAREAYCFEVVINGRFGNQLLAEGFTAESVARACHQVRRELGEEYKALTPAQNLLLIRARNVAKYGDPLGPSVEYLRSEGASWTDIVESAGRPGGKDLGL